MIRGANMAIESEIYALIMAGGSGCRLWPLSREMCPKQLLKICNDKTLFQSTFLRLEKVLSPKNILTLTNVKLASDVKAQLKELSKEASLSDVLTEPMGKNTAPSIGLGVYWILKQLSDSVDPVILVTPADHTVANESSFAQSLEQGLNLANDGYIVTFGAKAERPDTGFGYIKTSAAVSSNGLRVDEFKEKPDFKTAQEYVNSENYFWNCGIFMFKASVILEEFKKFAPDIINILDKAKIDNSVPSIPYNDFEKMPDISIDYAVMEKSDKIALVPLDCGWSDLGSWQAIFDNCDKDDNGNYIKGNVIDVDSKNSMIFSTSKLVTTIGLEDVVLIETEDAILACNKNKTQDVKKVYSQLKEANEATLMVHKTMYRPWGYYTVLQEGKGFLTKIIHVNPRAKLSIQLHHHRSEHWVVLEGKAKVVKGEDEIFLEPGGSVDLAIEEKHSLQNPYDEPLKIIEVQKGDILDENDIVRFEDMYGRA